MEQTTTRCHGPIQVPRHHGGFEAESRNRKWRAFQPVDMVTHMKTTIDIADSLLDAAKKTALRDGVTLRTLVEQGLRHVLQDRKKSTPFKLRDGSFAGTGLHPDAERLTWDEIRELSYGDRR
jgi:hypothetical protein